MTSPISKEDLKPGARFMTRMFPSLGLPDLQKVKIKDVFTLGDGTTVVRYRCNWPFPIDEDVELRTFIKNSCHVEERNKEK